MDNKSDYHLLIMKSTIEANRKDTVEKQINTDKKQKKTDDKLT